MKFNHIYVLPGHGHLGKGADYDRGEAINLIAEAEIIDGYVRTMVEEFENERLRYTLIETRKAPGFSLPERLAQIPQESLVISCHVGWNTKKAIMNMSQVLYNFHEIKTLAEKLSYTSSQWGRRVSWTHSDGGPRQHHKEALALKDSLVVEIEPFLLNLEGGYEYCKHLASLGKELGETIAIWVKSKNQNIARPLLTARTKKV